MNPLMSRLVIFTDLDGSLLDATTYSFDAAREALETLRARRIPLVLVSSKTRAEIEPIRLQLENHHPFICENGGGVFIPNGYFPFPLEGTSARADYQVVEFGTPYSKLRAVLKEVQEAVGCQLRGFEDMPVEEIAERTGLTPAQAALAKQREYDEPFILVGSATPAERVIHEIEIRKFHCTTGGRFFHLIGDTDKGRACRHLINCYRRMYKSHVGTLGIGDSLNDLPMLAEVDRPVLIQKSDGSYDPDIHLAQLIRVPGVGPVGWNRAILSVLQAA